MSCIFKNSKYYAQSRSNPLDICEPLGFNFLSNKSAISYTLTEGQLQYKQVSDKPQHKILSQRKTQLQRLEQFLKITQSPKRIQYLAPTFIDFMRNVCTKELFLSMVEKFVPHWKEQYSMIQLSQLISNPRVESLTHVEDFSLTKFIFFCQGGNIWRWRYLYQFFNRKIIQYPIQCQIVNHQKIQLFNLDPKQSLTPTVFQPITDITDVEQVVNFIAKVNETNKKKDPLYSGVHLYFADWSKPSIKYLDYFQRQNAHYQILQYYITMMTGILGDGQTAIIKLCGSFKHKTFQLLFLLKLVFKGKVSLSKPLASNPFLPDSYITCEYYNKTNGDMIHKYLLENYHLLKQHNDQYLLLDPKKMLKQDVHTNLRLFNQSLVYRGIQSHLNQFKLNSNIEYYPSKQRLLQKVIKYSIDLQPYIKEMIKIKGNKENSEKGEQQGAMEDEEKNKDQKEKIKDLSKEKDKQKDGQKDKNGSQEKNKSQKNNETPAPKKQVKGSLISKGFFSKKKATNPNPNTNKN